MKYTDNTEALYTSDTIDSSPDMIAMTIIAVHDVYSSSKRLSFILTHSYQFVYSYA